MNNELTLSGLMVILRRRRSTIAWSIAVCFLLAVVICIFKKPRYESVGQIEIQKSATDGLGLENLSGGGPTPSDALDGTITLQTEADILQSTNVAVKVIQDLNLDKTEDYKSTFNPIGWVMGLMTPSGSQDAKDATLDNSPHRRDHAVKVFEGRLKVKPMPGSRIIEIRYRSSDPKIAAAVVNDVAKSLVDYTLNSRYAATTQVSSWLSNQLGDIKREAQTSQAKVEKLQRESGIYTLGTSDASGKEMVYSSVLEQLQDTTQALGAATSNRILKGGLYKTVQNGDPELISGLAGSAFAGSSPGVNTSFSLLQNLRTQHAALASQYAQDVSRYGSANPKLVDEKAGLDALDAQIKSEVSRIGKRAENDYKVSQIAENNLRNEYNQERQSADRLNDKAVELMIAKQEASDAQNLYTTLYSHLKQAGVIEGLHSSNVSVVDVGRVPARPLPDVPLYLGLSILCGACIGVAAAMVRETTDDRVAAMTSVEDTLKTKILAILPLTQASIPQAGLGAKIRRQLASDNSDPISKKPAVLDGPNTAYVEALRGLRTSLLLPANGKPPKVILVTSAAEKEGKSTLSLNLAAVLVLNGSRVLLVDGDIRSAGLSGYLGFERHDSGLTDSDNHGLGDALAHATAPEIVTPFPELPRLSAVLAGPAQAHPSELLGSQAMTSLVKTWKDQYDHVVIDSPPVLAVTDAVLLTRLADMTLLVARHEETRQKSLDRAYKTLHDSNRTDIGIVVNGVRRDSVSYDEFYGYNSSAYYSEV